jgi:hypothetical protein
MARRMRARVMRVSFTMCNPGFTSANPCQVQVHVCMRQVRTRLRMNQESRSQGVKEKPGRGVPEELPCSNIQSITRVCDAANKTHLSSGAGLELRCHKGIHRVRERRQMPAQTAYGTARVDQTTVSLRVDEATVSLQLPSVSTPLHTPAPHLSTHGAIDSSS